ncbi:MAG: FtsX-like permease family protein [Saprospiraceae bacterium]
MFFPLKIARRYLFAKRTTNAINIISGISVLGITIGTAALIIVLSVFNGFEELLSKLLGSLNPDIKVTPATGKTFSLPEDVFQKLNTLEGVVAISETLEEVAFFEYKDKQDFGVIKGVDSNFTKVTILDSTIREGDVKFEDKNAFYAVVGGGMRNKLFIDVDDAFTPLSVYMPKRKQRAGSLEAPFRKKFAYPVATFVNQQDYDQKYIFSDIKFVRELLGTQDETSALEIKLKSGDGDKKTIAGIREILGEDFIIKNRYQQDEAFMKLMNVEKWLSFAILVLMMVLVSFNMIGSLWMIVLEKKADIAILKSMGADDKTIRNIFLLEGLLLTLVGIVIGTVLAIAFYWVQITYGIISFPGGFAFSSYPISMRFADVLLVLITVSLIGFLASILPARRAMKVPAMIKEE